MLNAFGARHYFKKVSESKPHVAIQIPKVFGAKDKYAVRTGHFEIVSD